jgi:WhiB family redox-sensing transcriptional regulator
MRQGTCRTEGWPTDLFYPPPGPEGDRQAEEARAVCVRCPVQYECRRYAYEHHISVGVWGGLSGRERGRGVRSTH